MGKSGKADDDAVIIKKYANRRLYNTQSSSYITLDHLSQMTRDGVDFKVVDAKTGDDITHSILTQIIMEEEASGEQMLPVSFLRQLIAMYGNSMQSMIPQYLEASMQHFRDNQAKLGKLMDGPLGNNPFAQLAQQNVEIFKAAARAFVPSAASGKADAAATQAPPAQDDELALLRAQMAEMQKKLDALGK